MSTNFFEITTGDTPNDLTIDNSRYYSASNPATIVFNDGVIDFSDLTAAPTSPGYPTTDITNWTYINGTLTFNTATGIAAQFQFLDESPEAATGSHIEVSEVPGNRGLFLTEGKHFEPSGALQIPGTINSLPPGITREGYATIYDTTTQAYIGDHYSHPYMGPVAGLQYDCEPITPDSLNITARANGMFIKTGSGNDAIALQGGTNVVDAGGGSNFLTGASGFDTFFLDARNIPQASSAAGPVPGAIWDTIGSFGQGDAATLWGIGPGTALAWQKNEGAVGHTGLTLHANMPNGSEASLTLAGVADTLHLSLSYGQANGANYLYVKAA